MKFSREAVSNALARMMEAVPGWVPFASAMALCYVVSSALGPGMRSWEPAFYSFLPMCFFFVGVNSHMMGRELRSLREKVARLEETHDGGDGGALRSMPSDAAGTIHVDRAILRRGLFGDPVGWSGSMVKTSLRFWLFALFFMGLMGSIVYEASSRGWRSALGTAIFFVAFQLMFMYAMRRMYFMIRGDRAPR